MIVSLDFELCSTLDLTAVGSDVWTRSHETLPISCAYAIDDGEPECFEFEDTRFAALALPLLEAVKAGAEIHAWNANFEWNVWNNIGVPRFGWPKLGIEKFCCTMCTAACAGLPMNLDDAAMAVGSPHLKDKAGKALMLRMSRPRSNKNGVLRWWHREDRAKVAQLIAYNIKDVLAERAVQKRIPRMAKRERAIWLVDQHMNARGLPVDQDLLTKLHEITLQELLRLNRDIFHLTNGAIIGASVNKRLLEWVTALGYPYDTLEKDTLSGFIRSPKYKALSDAAQGVLAARAEAAKTSTAKLRSMALHSKFDNRIRNLVQYGGATRTLRWAGRGPQIQNYPRPVIKHVDAAINEIKGGMDADGLRILFGRPLDVVSSCLRGVFEAPPGKIFVVADYHAIEAIVLAWLAEDDDLLDVFKRGDDIYIYTASMVGSDDRMLGKVLRLACGYGMGSAKFQETAAGYGLDLSIAEAKDAVDKFRRANAPIVSLWHGVEAMAVKAIMNPSDQYAFRKLRFGMANPKGSMAGSLLMKLPSDRYLVYRNARIENGRVVFWGVHNYTARWTQLDTYGGKLTENATQAVARDLLAEAAVAYDQSAPDTLAAMIHDEIIAECDEIDGHERLHGMLFVMSHPAPWAAGMPLSAAGAIVKRYGKLFATRTSKGVHSLRRRDQDGRWMGQK